MRGISDTLTLANDVEMPRLGLGTYKTPEGDEVVEAVHAALDAGYRLIDTASLYDNEHGIGRAISEGDIPREDIFLTTKVWNDEQGYENTLKALDDSLLRLGIDYVDLYLVHWPIPHLMEETWRAMEEIQASGKSRAIGVSNHLSHNLDQLAEVANVLPAVNQLEFHPHLQQPGLVDQCRSLGIAVEAWAPLMRGRVLEMPILIEIGERYDVSPAQVAIRWILQRDIVAIPKSTHPERIRSNAEVFGFDLSAEEVAAIDALDIDERVGRHPDSFADWGPGSTL